MGKERLSVHLRQSLVCDRGEETELLTYQDITDDLQVRGVVVLLGSQCWNTWQYLLRKHLLDGKLLEC